MTNRISQYVKELLTILCCIFFQYVKELLRFSVNL